ncbi:unnamed protein product [marine sediment metagenome]|uniref:HNH nuclease domain-containing protein n=1 Tax=marine sediment metagenome TaxID=412755 RepID=X0SRP4_9ZZZZ
MKKLLEFLYWEEGLFQREIAEIFKVDPTTIGEWMEKFLIKARPRGFQPGNLVNWKGGKRIEKGYLYHFLPDHPCAKSNGYVSEGRLVLENILGDFLPCYSIMHHFNKDSQDNRPENLMFFESQASHTAHHEQLRAQGVL